MVYIKKVELRAFKSFPNRTISITFTPNFNVITGLNGSGKSNIVDAIRFALGENSPKELRQTKMAKLIFDKEHVRSARVTLVVDNSDKKLPFDEDTVYISREVKENGESTYYVNHKKMLRGQVVELLEAARMSYNGLNIVPQGTITRLAELNPNERRHLLEALVGLKAFDEKKAMAMEKLREADQRLAVAFARLDEKRAQIERLEYERNELIRFELLERRIKEYRASIVKHEISNLEAKVEALKERIRNLEVAIREKEAELERAQKEVERLEKIRSDFYGANVDGIMSGLTEINRRLQEVRMRLSELENRESVLIDEKERIEESRPQLVQMLEEIRREHEKKKAILEDLERSKEEVRKKLEEISAKISRLEKVVERREKGLERWRNSFTKIQARLKKTREKRAETERLLAHYREMYEEEEKDFEDLKARYEEALRIVEGLRQKVKELEGLYLQDEKGLSEVKGKLEELEGVRGRLIREMTKANEIVLKSLRELSRAEAMRQAYEQLMKDVAEAERVEEFLSTITFEGFYGKLRDLVSPHPKYAEAVRAVMLPLAGALVVSDEGARAKLIDIIHRIKGGRVKILLANVKGRRLEADGKGIIGPVSDYIKCDKRVKGLVEALFGSTLLVTSHATAARLARQGIRAVTVDGTVYDRGVVEAGLIPKTALRRFEVDGKRLKRLKEALASLDKVLDRKKNTLEKLRSEIRKLYSISLEKNVDVKKKEAQLEVLKTTIKRYERLTERLRARLEKLEKSHSILAKRMEKLERYRERLVEKERVLEEKKEKVQATMDRIKLASLKEELNSLKQESSELISESMRLNLEASEVSRELFGEIAPRLKRIEETLKLGDQRLEEIEDELKKIKEELPRLREEKERLEEKKEKEEEKVSELTPTLKKIEEELQEAKRKEKRLSDRRWRLENEKMKTNTELEFTLNELESKRKEFYALGIDEPPEFHSRIPGLLAELEAEISGLYGAVNQLAKQSYREAYTAYKLASERRSELEKDRNAIVRFIEEVESEKRRTFMTAFEKIDKEVRRIFNKLTDGEAWLELEYPDDPFAGGVFLMVKFPDKSAREATAVSGGEKTVSAVSFLLALQAAYPSPFYVFDEIDQSLDARYTEKLGNLLREWAENVQVIAVSLKDILASKAHNLIGVYATGGVSNVVRYRIEGIAR